MAREIESPLQRAGMPSTLATEIRVERAEAEAGADFVAPIAVDAAVDDNAVLDDAFPAVVTSTHTAQLSIFLRDTDDAVVAIDDDDDDDDDDSKVFTI